MSTHACSALNRRSTPCQNKASVQSAKGGVWYCPRHLKKVQEEAIAAAAFLDESKKAAAKERALRNAADPLYHRCAANSRATLARCERSGSTQVTGTEDWLCPAHLQEAEAKATRPKASQAGDFQLVDQQCCGNKNGDCKHRVKYIVDDNFFCHLHNPNKVVKKCMGSDKCKGSGKYEVNGQNYCVAHNPEGERCGTTTTSGAPCPHAGVVWDGSVDLPILHCLGHSRGMSWHTRYD